MSKCLAAYILTIICVFDFGMCLFYTDSKEHDYPRIGKRKRFEDIIEKGIIGHKYRESTKPIDTLSISEAVIPSVLVFQYFDIDNDGYISEDEFEKRLSRELLNLIEKDVK